MTEETSDVDEDAPTGTGLIENPIFFFRSARECDRVSRRSRGVARDPNVHEDDVIRRERSDVIHNQIK
jgi:hypothetical protein